MPSQQEVAHHIKQLFNAIAATDKKDDSLLASKLKAYLNQLSSTGYDLELIRSIIQGAETKDANNPYSPIRIAIINEMVDTWHVLYVAGGTATQFAPSICHGSFHQLDAIVSLMSEHKLAFAVIQQSISPQPSPTFGPTPVPELEGADSLPSSVAGSPLKGPQPKPLLSAFVDFCLSGDDDQEMVSRPQSAQRDHELSASAEGFDHEGMYDVRYHSMSAGSVEDTHKRPRTGDWYRSGTPCVTSPPTPASEGGTFYPAATRFSLSSA